jgi:hypothetical protein
MKAYLKFAASFWMRAFVTMGSLGGAESTSTARAKKNAGESAAPVPLM